MGVIDLIFPKKCLECSSPGNYICKDCIKKVPSGGPNSIWKYQGVIRKAIIALKYKFAIEIANELVGYIDLPPSRQILVPIPTHWYKKNLRGFNQSELLGQKLATKMGWEFIPDLLIKKKFTPTQVGLEASVRRDNLFGAFTLNLKHKIQDNYLLFDDVFTTGSTIKEVQRILSSVGVNNIQYLTIAKQMSQI